MASICPSCTKEFVPVRVSQMCCSRPCTQKNDARQRRMDWCPICEEPAPGLRALSRHMKQKHSRIILEKDLNAAEERRQAKAREAEAAEEEMFA